jgi:endonuclease/exonuclease/phosphatase family metal-dependent hydrolase
MKILLKIILFLVGSGFLYLAVQIIYGTLTDYSPEEVEDVSYDGNIESKISSDTLIFYIWNIGYAGLGKESDFFYDGGQMVISPKDWVEKNMEGIKKNILSWDDADFILLQEVDTLSKRSYYNNQYQEILNTLTGFNGAFALNYKVNFVPIPITKPMGKVTGGLASYFKHQPNEVKRYDYPGNFPWPQSIYFLDRCFLLKRFSLENGKELLVINTHNSAYDTKGTMKEGEMDLLKDFITDEYEKGNFIVVGGDWNIAPPDYNTYKDKPYENGMSVVDNIKEDLLPMGWQWIYDPLMSTNRNLTFAFNPGETHTVLIDFFLVSPNIEVEEVKGIDLKFEYSDHQPVKLKIRVNQQINTDTE